MTYALGTDISKWQDNNSTPQRVNFDKMKLAGADFVFIKASQANWMDEDIVWNWNEAAASDLLRGAYHFLTWDVDPIKQADYFCGVIDHDPGELPPVCDYEWWGTIPSGAYTILRKFVERVEANLKRTPIIYTAPGFWSPYGTSEAHWAHYPLWVAHWGTSVPLVPKPWQSWTFWQFTDKGDGLKYGAESLNIDLDYYNGTLAELRAWCGLDQGQQPGAGTPVDLTGIYAEIERLKGRVHKLENWIEELRNLQL